MHCAVPEEFVQNLSKKEPTEVPVSPIQKPANILSLPLHQALKVIDIDALKRFDAMKKALQLLVEKQKIQKSKKMKDARDVILFKHCVQLFSVWAIERAKLFSYHKYNDTVLRSDEAIEEYHKLIGANIVLVVQLQDVIDRPMLARRVVMHVRETVINNLHNVHSDPRNIPVHKRNAREFKKVVTKACNRLLTGPAVHQETYDKHLIDVRLLFDAKSIEEAAEFIKNMDNENDPRKPFLASPQPYADIPSTEVSENPSE
jgi:hypothetical protein